MMNNDILRAEIRSVVALLNGASAPDYRINEAKRKLNDALATKLADDEREPAPENSLPNWSECNRIIENHEFRQRAAAGLEGQVLDTPPTSPEPTELHRFIYEYDESDSYRSAWFMHRLEKVIAEVAGPATEADSSSAAPSAISQSLRMLADVGSSDAVTVLRSDLRKAADELDRLSAPAPTGESLSAEEITDLRQQLREQTEKAKNASADADMYANAWQRELCAYDGKVYNKRHHIDAMVKTTQEFIKTWKASEAKVRELEAALATPRQTEDGGLVGMAVSMDVSTGDEDGGNRIFGTVDSVMAGADGKSIILAVEDSRNFAPKETAAQGGVPEAHIKAREALQRVVAQLQVLHEDREPIMAATIAAVALIVDDDLQTVSDYLAAPTGASK